MGLSYLFLQKSQNYWIWLEKEFGEVNGTSFRIAATNTWKNVMDIKELENKK